MGSRGGGSRLHASISSLSTGVMRRRNEVAGPETAPEPERTAVTQTPITPAREMHRPGTTHRLRVSSSDVSVGNGSPSL